jgi:hypothetical protein
MGLVRELDRLSRNLFCHALGSLALCRTADRAKKDARLARARAQGGRARQPVVPENPIRPDSRDERESEHHPTRCLPSSICSERPSTAFSSRGAGLNLFLWHQLNVALRRAPRHLRLRGKDRALLVWMTWLWPRLERHLRRILTLYSLYYNETRTHLGLEKDAPLRRPPNDLGLSSSHRSCPALHHRNARI